MSDGKKTNVNLVTFDFPEFLTEATKPASQEIGKAFGDIFYLVFSPITQKAERARIKHREALIQYAEDIKVELSKIPEENLVSPELSIVGPALDASKFYIENEILRKMFSNVIASSMNCETADKTRASFVEIIKQLSPVDAKILKTIYETKLRPLIHVRWETDTTTSTHIELIRNISWIEEYDYQTVSISIENLCRLKIIDIHNFIRYSNEKIYDTITNSHKFNDFLREIPVPDGFPNGKFSFEKGRITTNSFGSLFYEICVKNL